MTDVTITVEPGALAYSLMYNLEDCGFRQTDAIRTWKRFLEVSDAEFDGYQDAVTDELDRRAAMFRTIIKQIAKALRTDAAAKGNARTT
jgi:hypothetical protein